MLKTALNTNALRAAGVDLAPLITLSIDGLRPMFDEKSQLFCHRLKLTDRSLVAEGLSHRYTMMSLLGLNECEASGVACGFDIQAITYRLLEDSTWINNVGDLGLMLWLLARLCPDRLDSWRRERNVGSALGRLGEAQVRRTTELSWFLAGLAHQELAAPIRSHEEARDLAMMVYRLLLQNQGSSGLFGHQARTGTVSGLFRGHIGSFADQVYPIYALARFSRAFGVPEAAQAARRCAAAICHFQGRMGQWWWHYDARGGRVAERYPVYSVHQDGMAPMALFALAEETPFDFSEAADRGLQWIAGRNEAKLNLVDEGGKVIWRSIYHASRSGVWRDRLQHWVGSGQSIEAAGRLEVLHECRPYHLGWLLYAYARRSRPVTPEPLRSLRA